MVVLWWNLSAWSIYISVPLFEMLKSLKNHVFADILWRLSFLHENDHWVAHQVFDKMLKRTLAKFSQRETFDFVVSNSCIYVYLIAFCV